MAKDKKLNQPDDLVGTQAPAKDVPQRDTARDKDRAAPGNKAARLRLMLIWMATMAAMVVGIPKLAERFPEKFVWDMPTLSDVLETAGLTRQGRTASLDEIIPERPDEIVIRPRANGDRGLVLRAPLVASTARGKISVNDISVGFELTDKNSFPARVRQFSPETSCQPRKPKGNERLMSINVEAASQPAQLRLHQEKDLLAIESRYASISDASSQPPEAIFGGDMNVVDVFVTETSIPVYLVLQSMSDVVWNIQLAQGATLAHVVMIGENSAGISLPNDTTSYQAFLARDLVDCPIRPWREPTREWAADQKSLRGDDNAAAIIRAYKSGHEAYGGWYTKAFGHDTRSFAVLVQSTGQAMAGPRPLDPVAFRPYNGATIYVTNADHVILGSLSERNEQSAAIIAETLGRSIDVTQLHRDLAPR